jgi:hypothetical protein
LTSVNDFIYDKNENPKGYFSREFALRRFFLMTDDEWNMNASFIVKEKNEAVAEETGSEDSMDGGFGDDSGMGDMGGDMGGMGGDMGGGDAGGMVGGGDTAGSSAPPEAAPTAEPTVAPESFNFKQFYDNDGEYLFEDWKELDDK